MKKATAIVLLSAGLSLASASVLAENVASGFYVGLKTGAMIPEHRENNFNSLGFLAGYNFDYGLSAEYEQTHANPNIYTDGDKIEAHYKTQTAYGVWRSGDVFYGKVKAGVSHIYEDAKIAGQGNRESQSGNRFSTGVGAGVRIGDHAMVEAEYTVLDQNMGYASIAAIGKF